MKICIVGAGTMGAGIAQVMATGENDVVLCDIQKAAVRRGKEMIEKTLNKLVSKGRMPQEEADAALSRIRTCVGLSMAADCDLVLEAALEKMEVKIDIFQHLDEICSDNTIYVTNTSSLSITEIATATKRPERFAGMHFFNPAYVMKLVEIVRGSETSDATIEFIRNLAISIGKEPVEVSEAPGFVVNRILVPMINEAIFILEEGLASPEDIDKAAVLGANHPMGPLAVSDLVGNDVILAIMETLLRETGDSKYRPAPLLRKMVRARKLGKKTGEGFYKYN
jgi:3-hydroxybutyryl-CoA dehydrogenase